MIIKKRILHFSYNLLFALILVLGSSCTAEEEIEPIVVTSCFEMEDFIYVGVPTKFSSGCSENAVSFYWTFAIFGDSHKANPTFTFNGSGSGDITLTVTGEDGTTHTSSTGIQINE